MSDMHQIAQCCFIELQKLMKSKRLYVVLIFIAVYLNSVIAPIRSFSSAIGHLCSPWLYPFLMADPTTLIYIMFGAIVIFSNAPFVDEQQPYVIMRTSKKRWFVGQICYICVVSVLYFLFIYLSSVLILIPRLGYSQNWGKIIGTVIRTDAAEQIGVFGLGLVSKILLTYTPFQALGWCFLLSCLLGILIGLSLFFFNMLFNKIVGTVILNAFVLLAAFVRDVANERVYFFSPFSWVNLGVIDVAGNSIMPPLIYAIACLLSLCILLALSNMLLFIRRDVTVNIEE